MSNATYGTFLVTSNRWHPSLLIRIGVARPFKIVTEAGGQFKYALAILEPNRI